MQALVYNAAWNLSLMERPEPSRPTADQVLIRVRATGICGTDLGIARGEYTAKPGVVLGHESAGEVVDVGPDVRAVSIGDRVVIDPTYCCMRCQFCRSGRSNHCAHKPETETGVSSDGTFAPLHLTTERFVYRIPRALSFDAAALTEPLSCALTGVNQLRVRPTQRTAVLGGGPMGMLYAWALAARGVSSTVVEAASARRALCVEISGPFVSSAASLEEATERYEEVAPFDVIVDTTGQLANEALPLLARGGQLLLVGLRRSALRYDAGEIADRSLSIVGSIDSLDGSFASALELIASGIVPAERLVTHRMALDEFEHAFGLLGCDLSGREVQPPQAALKVVLQCAS